MSLELELDLNTVQELEENLDTEQPQGFYAAI